MKFLTTCPSEYRRKARRKRIIILMTLACLLFNIVIVFPVTFVLGYRDGYVKYRFENMTNSERYEYIEQVHLRNKRFLEGLR